LVLSEVVMLPLSETHTQNMKFLDAASELIELN